ARVPGRLSPGEPEDDHRGRPPRHRSRRLLGARPRGSALGPGELICRRRSAPLDSPQPGRLFAAGGEGFGTSCPGAGSGDSLGTKSRLSTTTFPGRRKSIGLKLGLLMSLSWLATLAASSRWSEKKMLTLTGPSSTGIR